MDGGPTVAKFKKNKQKEKGEKKQTNKQKQAQPELQQEISQQLSLEQAYTLVIENFNSSRYQEVERLCNAILQAEPNHVNAINVLGVVAQRVNRHDMAVELFGRAINIDPKQAYLHHNLGHSLVVLGQFAKAVAALKIASELAPDDDMVCVDLGAAYKEQKQYDLAIEHLQRAIVINPGSLLAHINIGSVYLDTGCFSQADAHFRQALQLDPQMPDIHYSFGCLACEIGQYEAAIGHYQTAIKIAPAYIEAYGNLAGILTSLGRFREALHWTRAAAKQSQNSAKVQYNLGVSERAVGNSDLAFAAIRQALVLEPENNIYWEALVQCYEAVEELNTADNVIKELRVCLGRDGVNVDSLRLSVESLLLQWPLLAGLMANTQLAALVDSLVSGRVAELFNDSIILNYLKRISVGNPDLEKFFTSLRRAFLHWTVTSAEPAITDVKLMQGLLALAGQCFLNEYAFFQSPEEGAELKRLETNIQDKLAKLQTPAAAEVLIIACYRPLFQFSFAATLQTDPELMGNSFLQPLFLQQIIEPRQEAEIKRSIRVLTPIDDRVSTLVREQYEENPYPRWLNFQDHEQKSVKQTLLKHFPYLGDNRDINWPTRAEILVAGCGTGRHPIGIALRNNKANVTAIDLSQSSLAYAIRKSREMNVENITFAQADILRLQGWEQKFDVIECAGVLHHMSEPMAGWKILQSFLKPGGFMKIGLYSEAGRRDIVAAREFIAKKGFQTTADGIRQFRQAIRELPAEDPLRIVLTRGDFSNLSTCRDLLFHVQEHRFTIPLLKKAIAELDLDFLGFAFSSASFNTPHEYRRHFPVDINMNSLDNWHIFEQANPDAFVGMYQFWLMKRPSSN